jgi:hypothetical protein
MSKETQILPNPGKEGSTELTEKELGKVTGGGIGSSLSQAIKSIGGWHHTSG